MRNTVPTLSFLALVIMLAFAACRGSEPYGFEPQQTPEGLLLGPLTVTAVQGAAAEEVQSRLASQLEGRTLELGYHYGEDPGLSYYVRRPEVIGNPFRLQLLGIDNDRAFLRLAVLDYPQYALGNPDDALITLDGSFSALSWHSRALEHWGIETDWNSPSEVLPVVWQASGTLDGEVWTASVEQLVQRRHGSEHAPPLNPDDWPQTVNVRLNPGLAAQTPVAEELQQPADELLDELLSLTPDPRSSTLLCSFRRGSDGLFRLSSPGAPALLAMSKYSLGGADGPARLSRLGMLSLRDTQLEEAWRAICPFSDSSWPPVAEQSYALLAQLPVNDESPVYRNNMYGSGFSDGEPYSIRMWRSFQLTVRLGGGQDYGIGKLYERQWNFGAFDNPQLEGLSGRDSTVLLAGLAAGMHWSIDTGLPIELSRDLFQWRSTEFPMLTFNCRQWIEREQPQLYEDPHPDYLPLRLEDLGGGDLRLYYSGPPLQVMLPTGSLATLESMDCTLNGTQLNIAMDGPALADSRPVDDASSSLPLTWTIRGSYDDQPFEIVATQQSWISL